MFRFLDCGSDLPHHAERVGYSAQGARVQKGARGEFITASLESPKAREQIAAIHCRDIARMQRLQCAQVVPIEEMAFETLEATDCLERTKIARHQVVDRDITKVVGRHGRQHPKPDVRRRSAQENFPHRRFLNIVWR